MKVWTTSRSEGKEDRLIHSINYLSEYLVGVRHCSRHWGYRNKQNRSPIGGIKWSLSDGSQCLIRCEEKGEGRN